MSFIGNLLQPGVGPFSFVNNTGLGANIGNAVSGFLNNNVKSTYSTSHPILNALFGTSQAYADAGSATSPTTGVLSANTQTGPGGAYPIAGGNQTTGGAAPSTGGQAAAPSGGTTGPSTDDQYISALRNAYGENANALQAENPLLDSAYQNSTNDINNQIDQQQKASDLQKQQNAQSFGDILKQNAQTYNEIGQQQRGTFSGLGTLDSSAFQDAQLKNGQNLADNQAKTQQQQAIQNNTIDNALTSFRQNALSKLADLGNQYQQGKLGIAQALANNDLSSANAIQNALGGIRQQAQNVQNSIMNFGLQAGLLSGYGKDVASTISGATGSDFVNNLLSSLGVARNNANSVYQLPTSGGMSGQGYIGVGSKGKIDPFTGQPVAQ